MRRRQLLLQAAAAGLLPWACKDRTTRESASPAITPAITPGPPRPSPRHPSTLAHFVDPLPVPRVLAPEATREDPADPSRRVPLYRVAMRATEERIHRDLPPVRVWSYAGSVPGPTIEARRGQPFFVEWRNELPRKHFLPIDPTLCGRATPPPEVRAAVHVHGGRVRPESDGNPDDWYTTGEARVSHYPNDQDAALLWYHDHAMGIARLNQYAGLFGLFVIRDEVEDALDLPRGPHEVPLVLFDRLLDDDAQLSYPTSDRPEAPWVPEVHGDAILVNGRLWPYLDVEPRLYRLRVLNASNARFYELALTRGDGVIPLQQIGADQGLLEAPTELDRVTLAPAERADLLVDLGAHAGERLVLRHQAIELMELRVAPRASSPTRGQGPAPRVLRDVPRLAPSLATRTRTLTLNEYVDPRTHTMLMLLNGTRWRAPVTETPSLNSVEIWELVNLTDDTHPIHLHLVRFQVLDRQALDVEEHLASGRLRLVGERIPPAPNEAGWKDTVRAERGFVTRIIIRFEGFTGRYAWHCHVLEHEANEMMRPFIVT